MDKTITVAIKNKIATNTSPEVLYVCGNSDYTLHFSFDDEWKKYTTKTARFVTQQNTYVDAVFMGEYCNMPIIENTHVVRVGVFAGNLCTTTPAFISTKKSILCGMPSPAEPPQDVYNSIMKLLNELREQQGTLFVPDETLTLENGVLSVNTADVVEADNTLPVTSAAVQATVGNIDALLKTI